LKERAGRPELGPEDAARTLEQLTGIYELDGQFAEAAGMSNRLSRMRSHLAELIANAGHVEIADLIYEQVRSVRFDERALDCLTSDAMYLARTGRTAEAEKSLRTTSKTIRIRRMTTKLKCYSSSALFFLGSVMMIALRNISRRQARRREMPKLGSVVPWMNLSPKKRCNPCWTKPRLRHGSLRKNRMWRKPWRRLSVIGACLRPHVEKALG